MVQAVANVCLELCLQHEQSVYYLLKCGIYWHFNNSSRSEPLLSKQTSTNLKIHTSCLNRSSQQPVTCFLSYYVKSWQDSWHLLLAERQSHRPLANVSLPSGYEMWKQDMTDPTSHIVETICTVPGIAILTLWALLMFTNVTRPVEQFCGARGKRQVSGAEYSSAEDKWSIDKHKVKGILGTDRENRDGRITLNVWKNGKLKVSQPWLQKSTATPATEAQGHEYSYKIMTSHFFHRIFNSKLFHL